MARKIVLAKKEYKSRLEYIQCFLTLYNKANEEDCSKNVSIKKSISATFNNISLTKIIDKVEHTDRDVMIVDYKTGQLKNAKKKFDAPTKDIKEGKEPTFEQKYGGDYWRQAVFCEILLDNSTDLNQRKLELHRYRV